MTPKRFLYSFEPISVLAVALYVVNRWFIRPTPWGRIGFFNDYLNDLLCIPIFLPPVLLIHRGLGLRTTDDAPNKFEIVIHLLVWSIYFEILAPAMKSVYHTTADPRDVAAYAAGALIAGLVWGSWKVGHRETVCVPPKMLLISTDGIVVIAK